MCNLYNVSTNQEAIRALTKAFDRIGNVEPSIDIYPDRPAPVVRNTPDGREHVMTTWGMPSPPHVLQGRPDTGVTNIRNVTSSLAPIAEPREPLPRAVDDVLRV